MSFEPSKYQKAIFQFIEKEKGNLIVNALAGAAKTTTAIAALNLLPSNSKILMCAFNVEIAKTLKKKAPEYVKVSTIHALGLRGIGKLFPGVQVDQDKVYNFLDKFFKKQSELKSLIPSLLRTISLSKIHLYSTAAEIDELMDDFDIDLDEEILSREEFIDHVLFTLNWCKKNTNIVDYDDMIWFPNIMDIKLDKYDYVFTDESQDFSLAQRNLVLKVLKKSSRCFVFGDHFQHLYGFAGAAPDSMERFAEALDAIELPLNISYRCPLKVISEAQKFVPALEAAPNALEGQLSWKEQTEVLEEAKPGCFILSRTNAPLIRLALNFLKRKIPANILGRNVSQGLLFLLKKSRAKKIDTFLKYLSKWEIAESKRVVEKGRVPTVIHDKAECLRALSEECQTVDDLKGKIKELFSDPVTKTIMLGTTHAAKGLEADDVFLVRNTFNTKSQEEKNIFYVAITRSKNNLYYFNYQPELLNEENKNVKAEANRPLIAGNKIKIKEKNHSLYGYGDLHGKTLTIRAKQSKDWYYVVEHSAYRVHVQDVIRL